MKLIVKATKPEVTQKQRIARTREKTREVVWCYVYCRKCLTDSYRNDLVFIEGRSESRN